MDKNQILKYEYCKKHLQTLREDVEKIPFEMQKYEYSQHSPEIVSTLQRVNQEMCEKIEVAVQEAQNIINRIIYEI